MVLVVCVAPFLHIMSGLNLAKHVHFEVLHMHLSIHGGNDVILR